MILISLCFGISENIDAISRFCMGFPGSSDGKESACNAGDLGSNLAWRMPMDRRASTVHGVAKSQTRLSD